MAAVRGRQISFAITSRKEVRNTGVQIPRLDLDTVGALLQFADECRQAVIERGEEPLHVDPKWLTPSR